MCMCFVCFNPQNIVGWTLPKLGQKYICLHLFNGTFSHLGRSPTYLRPTCEEAMGGALARVLSKFQSFPPSERPTLFEVDLPAPGVHCPRCAAHLQLGPQIFIAPVVQLTCSGGPRHWQAAWSPPTCALSEFLTHRLHDHKRGVVIISSH